MGSKEPTRGRAAAAALFCGAFIFLGAGAVTATGPELGFVSSQPAAPPLLGNVVMMGAEPAVAVPAPPVVFPDSPDQWFRPSGRNQGTEGLVGFLARLALQDNAPLYLSEGWGRTTGATNSDHHVSRTDSWAADVAVRGVNVPTAATETAARRISTALGETNWTGGDLTKTIAGYRFQVLWKVSGHFDHVHVGVRKVG